MEKLPSLRGRDDASPVAADQTPQLLGRERVLNLTAEEILFLTRSRPVDSNGRNYKEGPLPGVTHIQGGGNGFASSSRQGGPI